MVDLYVNKSMDPWTKSAKFVIEQAIRFNKVGDYFPVWGTCQGHELLNVIISGKEEVLTFSENWFKHAELTFTNENSNMFGSVSKDFK